MTTNPGVAAGFPQIDARFVDPKTGRIEQTWLQLLISLFNRTGEGTGDSQSILTDEVNQLQAQLSAVFADAGGIGAIRQAIQGLSALGALPRPTVAKAPDAVPAVQFAARGPDVVPQVQPVAPGAVFVPPIPGLIAQTGSWTPTPALATPGSSSFSGLTQSGVYFKVGPFVLLAFVLIFTPSIGTGSGQLNINGTPFACVPFQSTFAGSIRSMNSAFVGYAGSLSLVFPAASQLAVYFTAAGTTSSAISATNLTDGVSHFVQGSICYLSL